MSTDKQIEEEARMLANRLGYTTWPPSPADHETLREWARDKLFAREHQQESVKQAAAAARLLVEKTDRLPPQRRRAVEAMATHPGLTEEELAKTAGVSTSTVWEAKQEIAMVNGHAPIKAPTKTLTKLSGARIRIGNDTTPTAAITRAMKLHPHNQLEAAKVVGIHRETYTMIRKLIMLRDGFRISKEDREILDRVLLQIDRDRQISRPTRLAARTLIERNWAVRKEPGIERKTKRFDTTVMNISESCAATVEMVIPDLDKAAVIAAVVSLSTSVEQMVKLIRRIIGEKEET